MLQCVAVCCSEFVLQCVIGGAGLDVCQVCCSVLQCVAVCCSALLVALDLMCVKCGAVRICA